MSRPATLSVYASMNESCSNVLSKVGSTDLAVVVEGHAALGSAGEGGGIG